MTPARKPVSHGMALPAARDGGHAARRLLHRPHRRVLAVPAGRGRVLRQRRRRGPGGAPGGCGSADGAPGAALARAGNRAAGDAGVRGALRERTAEGASIRSAGWRGCSAAMAEKAMQARRRERPARQGPIPNRKRQGTRRRRWPPRRRNPGLRNRQPPPFRPNPPRRRTSPCRTTRAAATCVPARWWRASGSRPSSTPTASTARRPASAWCWSRPAGG